MATSYLYLTYPDKLFNLFIRINRERANRLIYYLFATDYPRIFRSCDETNMISHEHMVDSRRVEVVVDLRLCFSRRSHLR